MKDIIIATVISQSAVGDIENNLQQMEKWIVAAKQRRASMVCFPELNITGYSTRPEIRQCAITADGTISQALTKMAGKHEVVILAGFIEKGADDRFFASHAVAGPQGLLGIYRKIHIAPPERPVFTGGEDIPIFEAQGIRFGIQLCYDAHFPELSTFMAKKGVDVIFMPHASPRGTPEDKMSSWMRHLPARAYDNSIYVAAWNQIGENGRGLSFPGLSVVFAPSGKIVRQKIFQASGMMTVTFSEAVLKRVRENRMHYFLPNRRSDLFD